MTDAELKASDERIRRARARMLAIEEERASRDGLTLTVACEQHQVPMQHIGDEIFMCPTCFKRVHVQVSNYEPVAYTA